MPKISRGESPDPTAFLGIVLRDATADWVKLTDSWTGIIVTHIMSCAITQKSSQDCSLLLTSSPCR